MIFLTFFTAVCFDHRTIVAHSLHTAQAWFVSCMRLYTRLTHTLFAVVYTVHVHSISRLYMLSHKSPLLTRGCLRQTQHLSIIWFQIQTLFLKMLFQYCDSFFTQYSYTVFYRLFKRINIRNTLFNAFTFEFNSRFINEVELLFLYYHKTF